MEQNARLPQRLREGALRFNISAVWWLEMEVLQSIEVNGLGPLCSSSLRTYEPTRISMGDGATGTRSKISFSKELERI